MVGVGCCSDQQLEEKSGWEQWRRGRVGGMQHVNSNGSNIKYKSIQSHMYKGLIVHMGRVNRPLLSSATCEIATSNLKFKNIKSQNHIQRIHCSRGLGQKAIPFL